LGPATGHSLAFPLIFSNGSLSRGPFLYVDYVRSSRFSPLSPGINSHLPSSLLSKITVFNYPQQPVFASSRGFSQLQRSSFLLLYSPLPGGVGKKLLFTFFPPFSKNSTLSWLGQSPPMRPPCLSFFFPPRGALY